jgi:hypothetical protein
VTPKIQVEQGADKQHPTVIRVWPNSLYFRGMDEASWFSGSLMSTSGRT